MRPRLITIPMSHYCERARWALDYCEIDYVEDQHLQMFANRLARRMGAKTTVPALVTQDQVLADSADIVTWASQHGRTSLYPEAIGREHIEALERKFEGAYGDETRRVAYSWILAQLEPCLAYNAGAAPRYQSWALKLGRRFITPRLVRHFDITKTRTQASLDNVRSAMDDVADRLSDRRRFLCGDEFTAADLTFASMSAPVLLPARHGMPLPPPEVLDPQAQQVVEELRRHPAGLFALGLFEKRPKFRGELARSLQIGLPPGLASE